LPGERETGRAAERITVSYNGVTIPILWHAQITRGYPTAQWMTYKRQGRSSNARALEGIGGGARG